LSGADGEATTLERVHGEVGPHSLMLLARAVEVVTVAMVIVDAAAEDRLLPCLRKWPRRVARMLQPAAAVGRDVVNDEFVHRAPPLDQQVVSIRPKPTVNATSASGEGHLGAIVAIDATDVVAVAVRRIGSLVWQRALHTRITSLNCLRVAAREELIIAPSIHAKGHVERCEMEAQARRERGGRQRRRRIEVNVDELLRHSQRREEAQQ